MRYLNTTVRDRNKPMSNENIVKAINALWKRDINVTCEKLGIILSSSLGQTFDGEFQLDPTHMYKRAARLINREIDRNRE